MARRNWSADDIARLHELAATGMPYAEIATALGRTTTAIRVRAHKIGLRVPRETHIANQRAGRARYLKANPGAMRIIAEASNRRWARDGERERMSALAKSRGYIHRAFEGSKTPQAIAARAAANKRRGLQRTGWCPPQYRDEYARLRVNRGAAEARRIIEARHAASLADLTPFERMMAKVAAGAQLVERPVYRTPDPSYTLGGVASYG